MIKSVFWGVLAIYLPGGLGIPLMTAMRVNGVVSTAYGIFEWDEGIQKQELGNIGDVTSDTFNFGSDVICFGYDGVYHTIGEVSVFISKLEVSNVLWGYATRAFNSVTGTIKGLTKGIVWRKNVVGGGQGGAGVLEGANYAQRTYSNTFSVEGRRIYSKLAGEQINTIDDLIRAINEGRIRVEDLPIEYIVRDGNVLILNTRTSQALTRAGIPRSQWNAVDRTGNTLFEELLSGQLSRNRLTSEGISTVRPSGGQ